MCDVARCTLTDANSFAGKNIVNIYKIVMGSHSQVLSRVCKEERQRLLQVTKVHVITIIVKRFYYCGASKCSGGGGPRLRGCIQSSRVVKYLMQGARMKPVCLSEAFA